MSEVAGQIVDQIQAKVEAPTEVKTEGTEAPVEAKPQEPTQTKADDKFSSRLETLIKKEQSIQARDRIVKQKESELEARFKRLEEFETVKTKPKKALEFMGLTYDELTKSMLTDGEVPPEVEIRKVKTELDDWKKSQEEKEAQKVEDDKKYAEEQEKRAVDNFKSEIGQYLSDNSERYELIKFEGQEGLVFEVIDEHYRRTIDPETGAGKVMKITEAADKVEEFLEKKYEKSRGLNKVKVLWEALPKQAQTQAIKAAQPTSQKPKTLTNNMSATAEKPRARMLTDDERVQKAIAYAKGLRPSIS